MGRSFGLYIIVGLGFGAVFGVMLGKAIENAIMGIALGALAGAFVGWFIAAQRGRGGVHPSERPLNICPKR
jgi:NhaP-type Na+/H+ or K+/H+ antiporter